MFAEEVPDRRTHILNGHLVITTANTPRGQGTEDRRICEEISCLSNCRGTSGGIHSTQEYWTRYDHNPQKQLLFQIDWLAAPSLPRWTHLAGESGDRIPAVRDRRWARKATRTARAGFVGCRWNQRKRWMATPPGFATDMNAEPTRCLGPLCRTASSARSLPEPEMDDFADAAPAGRYPSFKDESPRIPGQGSIHPRRRKAGLRAAASCAVGDRR